MLEQSERPQELRPDDSGIKVVWIERTVVVLLFLGLLVGVMEVLKPFTTAILFGAAVATAAWPLRQFLVSRGLGRGIVAALLLLCSLLLIVVPVLVVAPHLADHLAQGTQRVQVYFAAAPQQPAWLSGLPLIGKRAVSAWARMVEVQGNLHALLEPYAARVEQTIVLAAQDLADSVVQLILSLVVATMFWVNGDAVIRILHLSLQRLGGETADHILEVASGAIRGVAYGVVGTAAIQGVLLAAGLAVAGVPGAGMLGFVALLIAITQIGAPLLVLIWGGAAWWLFGQDHQLAAAFMIIWGLFISTVDNFLKPWLIGFGTEMPLSLTILGVFGGFIAFGFLGLFIGPTLIAVIFTLLQAWQRTALAD
jgi:predicted PurR-regulated permease PerM